MSETPFVTFIELIKVDQAIVDQQSIIKKMNNEIEQLKGVQNQHFQIVTQSKNNLHDAQKDVDQLELELKTLDQQEKQKKERMEHSTDYKHYQSLKAEIDLLKHKQHRYEEVLMTSWNKLEAAKKEYEQAQKEYPSKTADIDLAIALTESEIVKVTLSLNEFINQRPAREKLVPAEWLEKYAVMHSRVSDPVVPVENGSCSACYYKVPQQDMTMLAHRKLLQCKSCYRLLYSAESHKQLSSERS